MKICFVTYGELPIPPVKGGAVENLVDLLLRDNQEKHTIDVYSIYNNDARLASEEYENCNFRFIKINKNIDFINKTIRYLINRIPGIYIGNLFIKKCMKFLEKNSYDLIVVENKPEYGLILKKLNTKLILHLHNDVLNKNTKLSNKILSCYDTVYTVSDYISERVKTIDRNMKIKVLYNGIDTRTFNNELYIDKRLEIRDNYNIGADDIVFIYSGRLIDKKGVKELIDAFVNIEVDHIKLLIVGSVNYGETITDSFTMELMKIASSKASDVVFTGYVNYNMLPLLLGASDIAIVPSKWNEPSGLVVCEALSAGLPLITTNVGGIPEIVDSNCAIIVDPNKDFVNQLKESMLLLINNEDLRINLSINGRKRAALFSKENYCKNFYQLIREDI